MEKILNKKITRRSVSPVMKAIAKALEEKVAFAAYVLPGDAMTKMHFIADIEGREPLSGTTFSISPWNTQSADRIILRDTVSVQDFLAMSAGGADDYEPEMTPWRQSTPFMLYKGQIISIIADLRKIFPSKTVLSRVIGGHLDTDDSARVWTDVAARYFARFRNTFRYIYYTPVTGGWIGASPEILLTADKEAGRGLTMALAGTREVGGPRWDFKNTIEQGMVFGFIRETFEDMGIKPTISKDKELKFGDIEHICTRFEFDLGSYDAYAVIDRLNPTPALSGNPRDIALGHISHLELHPRYCYGGYVAVENEHDLQAYVNLRCVHFSGSDYCLYAGGGITQDSVAESEWQETVNKIGPLQSLISEE